MFALLVGAVTISICELILRVRGLTPYTVPVVKFEYKPKLPGRLDPVYGHVLVPGYFTITKNDTFTYHATQDSSLKRITSLSPTEVSDYPEKVAIIGCSFTYGDCLEDSMTHPFLLQQLFTSNHQKIKVENWGVGGYCPTHFYLQALNVMKDTAIRYVVINYSSWVDERTICGRSWRKAHAKFINERKHEKQMAPYFAATGDKVQLSYKSMEYRFLPFQRNLALVEYADELYCKYENRKAAQISQQVLMMTMDTLQKKGVTVILASLSGDSKSNAVIEKFNGKGYNTLLYGICISDNTYNFEPIDGHPNYRANKIFAEKIFDKINSLRSVAKN